MRLASEGKDALVSKIKTGPGRDHRHGAPAGEHLLQSHPLSHPPQTHQTAPSLPSNCQIRMHRMAPNEISTGTEPNKVYPPKLCVNQFTLFNLKRNLQNAGSMLRIALSFDSLFDTTKSLERRQQAWHAPRQFQLVTPPTLRDSYYYDRFDHSSRFNQYGAYSSSSPLATNLDPSREPLLLAMSNNLLHPVLHIGLYTTDDYEWRPKSEDEIAVGRARPTFRAEMPSSAVVGFTAKGVQAMLEFDMPLVVNTDRKAQTKCQEFRSFVSSTRFSCSFRISSLPNLSPNRKPSQPLPASPSKPPSNAATVSSTTSNSTVLPL